MSDIDQAAELAALRLAVAKLIDVYAGHDGDCASHFFAEHEECVVCGHRHSVQYGVCIGCPCSTYFEARPRPCNCGYTPLVESEPVRRAIEYADAQTQNGSRVDG